MTKIYQMVDELAEQAGPTFEAVNDAVALRGTQKHREANDDLSLWCVGEREFEKVGIKAYAEPVLVYAKPIQSKLQVVEHEN